MDNRPNPVLQRTAALRSGRWMDVFLEHRVRSISGRKAVAELGLLGDCVCVP
jgi:hypothetical protein